MTDERITKINKIGKVSKIIAKIILVCVIIASIASAGISIAGFFVPDDIAKVSINGTAQINISEKYLELGKKIISEVNEGMTEEGQILEIDGKEFEYISADVDGNNININYKSPRQEIGVRNFAVFTASTCLDMLNTIVLLCFVIALCKAIQNCQSPFEEDIIDKMKRLTIAIVPWVIIRSLAQSISAYAFCGKFEYNLHFDFGLILIILVLALLVFVFKYGADLQRQSDETL